MGLKNFWIVARSNVPAKWRPLLMVLAIMAKDKTGGDLFPTTERLAEFLGLHRSTVSALLAKLDQAGLVTVEKRGGRWFSRKKQMVVGRANQRRFHPRAVQEFGRRAVTTRSPDLVGPSRDHRGDLVVTPRGASDDLVVSSRHIKNEQILETKDPIKDRIRSGKSVCKTARDERGRLLANARTGGEG